MGQIATCRKNSIAVSGPAFTREIVEEAIQHLDTTPATREQYRRKTRHLLAYLESRRIARPTRLDIMEYRDTIREKSAPSTVAAYITAARQVFRVLAAAGLYPDITQGVRTKGQGKQHKRDALTRTQARSLIDAVDTSTPAGLRDYAMINLMLRAGLRTIEVSRARVKDLRTIDGIPVLFVHGKGKEEAAEPVPLTAAALDPIRAYLRTRGNASPEAPLFTAAGNRNHAGQMTTRSIRRVFKAATLAAGIDAPTITAHSCRHTAVTLALQAGATLQEVQAMARHARIETTLIYAHNLDVIHNTAPGMIDF